MKFFSVLLVALMAVLAEAKVAFTNSVYDVQLGKPFTLLWAGNTGPVNITLKNGPKDNLKTVLVIDTNDSGSSFTWTPPTTLPSDTYAFEIKDSVDTNWSPQFTFQGSASASGSRSSTGSASSASSTLSTTTTSTTASTGTSSSGSSSSNSASSTAGTSSTFSTAATTTRSTATTTPTNTNNGQRYQSSLALVLVTVAALLYLN